MKICGRCKAAKPYDSFYKRLKSIDGYQSACKECMEESYQRSRLKKHVHYKQVQTDRVRKNKKVIDDWKASYGCRVCKESDPSCLDMHHLDPTEKESTPSNLRVVSINRFMVEAAKCIVLCANCHRKVHAGKIELSE